MIKNIFLASVSMFAIGCSSQGCLPNETDQPRTETPTLAKGIFTGSITIENKEPYANGTVKATGADWETISTTNELGEYSIEVKRDERFVFSALSPYGDEKFYKYDTPIIINEEETSEAYDCVYGKEIEDCYEAPPVT